MNTGIFALRKHWLVASAVVVLLAIALTAGALFAANERQQPEAQPLPQQSVADATDPGRAPDLPAAPPAPERVFIQPADNDEEEIDLPPIVKVPPTYPNLDSNLNRLAEEASSVQEERSDGSGSVATSEPVLVTFYVQLEYVDEVRQYLEDNGVYVRNVGEDYIEAHVPPGLLGIASEQPGVLRVDTVISPRRLQSQTRVISQGVGLHGADVWHSAGYRGNGVKVGIIDSGFQGFRGLQGSELPANVTARCYFEGPQRPSSDFADCIGESSHGTAVAETLIDIAPNAELYITNSYSGGDLRDAVEWMAGQGVTVINASLGWPYDGPGNGTSPNGNSPLRAIDTAVSNGISWINAAGNEALRVWYGPVSDPNNNGYLHFTGDWEVNQVIVEPGEPVLAIMRWDDDWGGADCDLDLLLLKWDEGMQRWAAVKIDDRPQNGGAGSIPLAWVQVDNAASDPKYWDGYSLAIHKGTCTSPPAWIQLRAGASVLLLQHPSSGHHMGNPEESRNPGMLAVGATHYWDTNTIAEYSSRGPTLDGRTKPDITGVACGVTDTYTPADEEGNQCWFRGTSQAAPHVAGMAALVKQRFPNYDPAETVDYLEQNAADRGATGDDNTWGHGLAALPVVQTSAPSAASPPTANIEVRAGNNSGEVIVSWDAVPEATHYRIGYVNMEVDYHFAKASCTGEWIEAFVYVDVNARNIPVSDGQAEYTIRRLAPGARHAFTVLTSNNFVDTGGGGSVSSEFFWPSNPRWTFLPGRNTLPAGVTIPPCRP